MSEIKINYQDQRTPISIDAFKNRNCGLGIEHIDYIPPTSFEVIALRKLLKLTQNELASFTGNSFDKEKGSSTIRKWESSGCEKSRISPAAWQLMLIKADLIEIV